MEKQKEPNGWYFFTVHELVIEIKNCLELLQQEFDQVQSFQNFQTLTKTTNIFYLKHKFSVLNELLKLDEVTIQQLKVVPAEFLNQPQACVDCLKSDVLAKKMIIKLDLILDPSCAGQKFKYSSLDDFIWLELDELRVQLRVFLHLIQVANKELGLQSEVILRPKNKKKDN